MGGKEARLNRTILALPKLRGGFRFPDSIKYQESYPSVQTLDGALKKKIEMIKKKGTSAQQHCLVYPGWKTTSPAHN